jgi:hypothetical protein
VHKNEVLRIFVEKAIKEIGKEKIIKSFPRWREVSDLREIPIQVECYVLKILDPRLRGDDKHFLGMTNSFFGDDELFFSVTPA